jgi:3-oxoacyl-[acyl-carrier protein] reductase
MDLGLKGLRAVIAGGSKGIGRYVTEALIAEGCDVAFCARDQGGIDTTVAALSAGPGKVRGYSVDIADAAAYSSWIDAASRDLGGCDIFMCFSSGKAGPATEDLWEKNFQLDVMATWRGIEAALPHLRQSANASIIAIASSVAIEPAFGPQTYSTMKAAVTHYAGALATKLAPEGIRVNTVSPGMIMVEGGDWDTIKAKMPTVYDANLAKIPLGRLGTPKEIARAIVFAASPACGFMVGANLVLDGGLTRRVQH